MSFSGNYKLARCPFYSNDAPTKRLIRCEGVIAGTTTIIAFDDEEAYKAHMGRYCKSIKGCKACPINNALSKKYE